MVDDVEVFNKIITKNECINVVNKKKSKITKDISNADIVTKKYDNLQYIFRDHIPIEYLLNVLDIICIVSEKQYIINFNAFRLLQYHNLFPAFSEKIKYAYKPSKHYFLTRTLTYNSFITIVRHICRINHVSFEAKFNYQHSLYNIDYYIKYHRVPP